MPLLETDYCIEQIEVPPRLPHILKQFCKSAIRTQPYDLLRWSSAYFHALAQGEEPPVKLRLEFPPNCSAHGLTLGYVKALFRQLGANYNKYVCLNLILRRWDNLCLDHRDSDLIICIGGYRDECQVKEFLSVALGLMTRSLTETMILVCELFTFEPDGGSAMIPIRLFMDVYHYLGGLRCDGGERGNTEELCICSLLGSSSGTTLEGLREDEPAAAAPVQQQDSLGSQDTQADIDLDLDSYPREDAHAGITLRSFGEETGESYLHEGEASLPYTDSYGGSHHPSLYDNAAAVAAAREAELSLRAAQQADEAAAAAAAAALGSAGSGESAAEVTPSPSDKCESKSHYPDVPGIGRRLLPEEMATVAIWLTDCARRQDGMIGPRNIRHINCPPLEGCGCGGPSNDVL